MTLEEAECHYRRRQAVLRAWLTRLRNAEVFAAAEAAHLAT